MPRWTADDIPDQTGRSALVTGTGGLGFEVARELARKGGDIILAGRNRAKGEAAIGRLKAEMPGAAIRSAKSIWPASLRSPLSPSVLRMNGEASTSWWRMPA